MSRDYGLKDQNWIPGRGWNFSWPLHPHLLCICPASYTMDNVGVLSPGARQPGRCADCLHRQLRLRPCGMSYISIPMVQCFKTRGQHLRIKPGPQKIFMVISSPPLTRNICRSIRFYQSVHTMDLQVLANLTSGNSDWTRGCMCVGGGVSYMTIKREIPTA